MLQITTTLIHWGISSNTQQNIQLASSIYILTKLNLETFSELSVGIYMDLAEGFSWDAAFGVESLESGLVIVWASVSASASASIGGASYI